MTRFFGRVATAALVALLTATADAQQVVSRADAVASAIARGPRLAVAHADSALAAIAGHLASAPPERCADRRAGTTYRAPGGPGGLRIYLGYAPGAYLGRVVDQLLKESGTAIHLDRVYETDMAEGLKVMALEGHGIAFLPQSAVRKEIKARKLVSALPSYLPVSSMLASCWTPVGVEAWFASAATSVGTMAPMA